MSFWYLLTRILWSFLNIHHPSSIRRPGPFVCGLICATEAPYVIGTTIQPIFANSFRGGCMPVLFDMNSTIFEEQELSRLVGGDCRISSGDDMEGLCEWDHLEGLVAQKSVRGVGFKCWVEDLPEGRGGGPKVFDMALFDD